MNCGEPVEQSEAKLFAEVFVCPNCYLIATRIEEKAKRDVRALLVMMREAIRIGLVQGKLQFRTVDEVEDVSKADLLHNLAEITQTIRNKSVEDQKNECQKKTEPSSPTTKPNVAILGATGSSSSETSDPSTTK